jgi:hypothetical protein
MMAKPADPYHDGPQLVHFAHLIAPDGGVSPLCAKAPRRINVKRATWTNRPGAVTCPRCIQKITAARDS